MKLKTTIRLNEKEKAEMIGNGRKIPNSTMTFEMSPEKSLIFSSPLAQTSGQNGGLTVTDDTITVESIYIGCFESIYIQGGLDSKDGMITGWKTSIGERGDALERMLCPDIVQGKLNEGDNIDSYLEKLELTIQKNTKAYNDMQKQIAEFPAHAPQREAAKQAYEAEQEKLRLEKAAKDAAEKAIKDAEAKKASEEKENKRLERLAWAQEHGSDRLRKGLEHGHNCVKLYESELGEYLIQDKDYEYDREGIVEDKARSCPSLAALEEVERIEEVGGLSASIVWLPEGLTELHKEEYNEPESGCEAVRIYVKGTAGYWYKTF